MHNGPLVQVDSRRQVFTSRSFSEEQIDARESILVANQLLLATSALPHGLVEAIVDTQIGSHVNPLGYFDHIVVYQMYTSWCLFG